MAAIQGFATKSDLLGNIAKLEAKRPLLYVVDDVYDSKEIIKFDSLTNVNDLGICKTGDHFSLKRIMRNTVL